jgi:5,10-methylenetetrahydrofolate reductase
MAERCGTKISKEIVRKFSNNPADNEKAAIEICIKQLKDLQAMGVNSFHFYTLNQSTLLRKIFDEIGVLS